MFRLTTYTKYLLLANVFIFLIGLFMPLDNHLGLHFFLSDKFNILQLFTYMFCHAGISHIFFNMFALWMFGCVMESVWGGKKFLFYYICCGVGAGIMQEIAQAIQFYVILKDTVPDFSLGMLTEYARLENAQISQWTTVGASGAVYGILLAFGMTFPNERLIIFPLPIPIKAKWFVTGYIAIELFQALNTSNDGVAHFAHLGGMLFGFLMIRHWNKQTFHSNMHSGINIFENLKDKWFNKHRTNHAPKDVSRQTDWEYNQSKKQDEQEMDQILDKIRKSGYDSLSAEEKRRLFDFSNK